MIKTLAELIGPKRKKQLLALVPVMLLASLLEMAGLTVVVSVCASIVDAAWLRDSQIILWLREALHIQSETSLTVVMLLALIGLYMFKLPYLAWENYVVAKYVCTTQQEVALRLCGQIIHSPYLYFVRHSTAEFRTLLGQDMVQFSSGLDACMRILMEAPVLLGMGACLLLIDPAMTSFVAAGIVCLMVLTRVILVRPIKKMSQRQRDANLKRWKWLHHITGGIKDIKIGRREDFYEAHFTESEAVYVRADYLRRFWVKLPTLCIECVMVLTVLLYILHLVSGGKQLPDYLPSLSALAWTAVRLLPSFSGINASLTQIGYARASIEAIRLAMEETAARPAPDAQTPQAEADIGQGIVLRHVSYAYEGSPETVLRDVDMEIPAGSSVGIIGPSGAGKTTLLDVLLGLLVPEQGDVLAGGVPIRRCYESFLEKVAYVPQDTFLLDDTVRNNVAMGEEPGQIDDAHVWEALERASLARMIRGLLDGLDTTVGERGIRLSGGERQRLGLARALYRNCPILILDEATSALDQDTEAEILQTIYALKGEKTIVIVSHRSSAIAACDRIYKVEGREVRQIERPPLS